MRQIPWGHNREIISKCKDIEEAIFYVQQTITNNWSRAVLVAQIETKLYNRQSIGILLCKTPNKVVVEYALKNVNSPLGVAEYQLKEAIPDDLKGAWQ